MTQRVHRTMGQAIVHNITFRIVIWETLGMNAQLGTRASTGCGMKTLIDPQIKKLLMCFVKGIRTMSSVAYHGGQQSWT